MATKTYPCPRDLGRAAFEKALARYGLTVGDDGWAHDEKSGLNYGCVLERRDDGSLRILYRESLARVVTALDRDRAKLVTVNGAAAQVIKRRKARR